MNWLNSLLRKPPPAPARPVARRTAPPAPPPVDTGALREALNGVVDDAERARQEAGLGRALGANGQTPQPGDSPAVWTAAISHGADKALALGWLDHVTGDATLAQIACDARFAEVRLAAAQRIVDSGTLETVARASKNRDKGVYRHCADLLRARREGMERAEHAAQIAQTLQKLLGQAPLSVSHLLEVERSWKALSSVPAATDSAQNAAPAPAVADVFQQCRRLLDQANARILEEAEAQRALQGLAASYDLLATQIGSTVWPEPAVLEDWQQRHNGLAQSLAALPGWLAQGGTAQAVGGGLQALAARLDAWAHDHAALIVNQQFLAGLPAGVAPNAETVAAWESLPKPGHAPLRQDLDARWHALAAPAVNDAPPPPPAAARPAAPPPPEPGPQLAGADLDTLRTQLEQLEQSLEAGQLIQADAAAKLVKATQGAHSLDSRLDARLQRALLRLGELRGWAQWGANKKREDLIDAAQQLAGTVAAGAHDVEHLAVAIPALREEWKRLNAQGPAAKGQWESFDRSLEAAYVPVAAFRAEEAERRNQARAVREGLLTHWETALSAIDWSHPDQGAIDALRESMVTQWRAAPHAGYRDERLLRARFDTLVHGIDERLDAGRAAEIQRRESLIAAVTALADLADTRQATTQAKTLQERWRTEAGPLRLRRGEEQKLWQRFRAGCDAVFSRRDAERAAQDTQRKERAQARAALLTAFAALLDSVETPVSTNADGGVSALKQAISQFSADWDASIADAGEGSGASGGQDRQARELLQRSQQCLVRLQGAAVAARYAALAQSAPATDGVDPARLEAGRVLREEILIDLEIALGLTTPGAAAEIRRRRQLEQLQNRFRTGPAPSQRPQDPDKLLAQWYATVAAPEGNHDERIAAVVRTLVERQRNILARSAAEPARRDTAGGRSRGNPGGAGANARSDARPGPNREGRPRRQP